MFLHNSQNRGALTLIRAMVEKYKKKKSAFQKQNIFKNSDRFRIFYLDSTSGVLSSSVSCCCCCCCFCTVYGHFRRYLYRVIVILLFLGMCSIYETPRPTHVLDRFSRISFEYIRISVLAAVCYPRVCFRLSGLGRRDKKTMAPPFADKLKANCYGPKAANTGYCRTVLPIQMRR